jgi:protein-histidine pros-kinase
MSIRTKFNLGLLAVFAVGFVAAWFVLQAQFVESARREVLQNARVMLSAANAVREYTQTQVGPALHGTDAQRFQPLTVPSFAAHANFRALRAEHPAYSYKEAALNPTNPHDLAEPWEAEIINVFRARPEVPEIVRELIAPTGRSLTLSRPITLRDPGCLACHGSPDRAPPAMLRIYGRTGGFGWQMNETVGAQIVTVPLELALNQAQRNLYAAMGVLFVVFLGLMAMMNLLLHLVVVRPITRMGQMATELSLGREGVGEFPQQGKDEVGELGRALTRMRRSLDQALQMLAG